MAENQPTAGEIKSKMDELRKEWDRLDAHGSQSERQSQISRQLDRLRKQLKDLHGEDY
jgi:chromosome segregation ATPase